jgi:hypothetical protein
LGAKQGPRGRGTIQQRTVLCDGTNLDNLVLMIRQKDGIDVNRIAATYQNINCTQRKVFEGDIKYVGIYL